MAGRTYRLTVEGELSQSVASSLGGMTLDRLDGTTTWTAFVRDQAELHGLFRRVADLGLTVIAITVLDNASLAGRRDGGGSREALLAAAVICCSWACRLG
jgi:hypothetical protein